MATGKTRTDLFINSKDHKTLRSVQHNNDNNKISNKELSNTCEKTVRGKPDAAFHLDQETSQRPSEFNGNVK